jgi:pilus assembly protein CpaE
MALIASEDAILVERCLTALAGLATLHRCPADTILLGSTLLVERPALILIDAEDAGIDLAAIVAAARRGAPAAALVVLGDEGAADQVLALMRAGAQDVIGRDAAETTLRRALRPRLARGGPASGNEGQAACLTLLGARASDPSREVALALAISRCGKTKRRVLLMDLAPGADEIEVSLDLRCSFGVLEAINDLDRLDAALLSSAATRHAATGLSLLPLLDYRGLQGVEAADLRTLLAVLRSIYDEVVLHAGADPVPAAVVPLLAEQRRCALVTEQSLASAQAAGRSLALIEGAGGDPKGRVVLAVANTDSRILPSPRSLLGALGLVNIVTLPEARTVLRNGANRGRFPEAVTARRPYLRALEALGRQLDPATETAAKPAGPLARLLRRRA